MKKSVICVTALCVIATGICSAAYLHTKSSGLFSVAIAFGTTAYHLLMRLCVGLVIGRIMENKADLTKKWYQSSPFEEKLYAWLHVKQWKKHLPTFDSQSFDRKTHSWQEIAQALCQAEIVHEVIVVLSFLPIIFSKWVGSAAVFITTSVVAALLDLICVIVQRYNRPRILRLISRRA